MSASRHAAACAGIIVTFAFALAVAASLAAAQSFDCNSGSVLVPPGDYGAITIDTGATACGSVTIADVAAVSIVINASSAGAINVTGAIAITRLTCRPAATVCVEFASAVVAADSITLRGATYNSTIVLSSLAEAIVLSFQGAVSGVHSLEVSDVDMRVNATSTGGVVSCFLTYFASSATVVSALTWRDTTLVADLKASSTVFVATAWFQGAVFGTNATTLTWDGVSQRVVATSSSGVVLTSVAGFLAFVTGVSALTWRNTTVVADLKALSTVFVATTWFQAALFGADATSLSWDGVSQRVNATSSGLRGDDVFRLTSAVRARPSPHVALGLLYRNSCAFSDWIARLDCCVAATRNV
jgi:hypothetical protein